MKFFGFEFAPFSVPFTRRMQTVAVLHWQFCFLWLPIVCTVLVIFFLFIPFLNILTLAYFVFLWFDSGISTRGGRRFEFVRRLKIWEYFRDYFPISLVKTAELPRDRNYILGYHPHGIMGAGAFCNFGTEATDFSKIFPGIKPHLLTLKANFRWPLLRAYILAAGCCDVSKESIEYILSKKNVGNAVIIVVGGAEEALLSHPHSYSLKLKERKGYAKMALKTGTSLVPVFSFGENDLFKQADNPEGSSIRHFQEKFKDIFGFAPPFFYGRGIFNYTFGFVPFRKPVVTVVGKPIDVVPTKNPSQEEIDELHDKYMKALNNLFDEHKTKHGVSEDTCLTFV